MIKRELYMNRIHPFIGTDLIKVMTDIRRCGKSVMLELIKQELIENGIREAVFGGNLRDMNLTLENIVYLELLCRGYQVTVGRTGNREIDFVCHKREEKLYVQVTLPACVRNGTKATHSLKCPCLF